MARPVGALNSSSRRALAIRLAIEERLKKSLPEKILDLVEELHDKRDKLEAYKCLLPYCYPKLIAQAVVDASDMGIETHEVIKEKEAEYLKLIAEQNELKSTG